MQDSEKDKLIGTFEELKQIETKASVLYTDLLKDKLSDHEAEIIESIRRDEIKHIQIAQEIITLIKEDK